MAKIYVIQSGLLWWVGGVRWSAERPDAYEFDTWEKADATRKRVADFDGFAKVVEEGADAPVVPAYAFNADGEQAYDYDTGDDD